MNPVPDPTTRRYWRSLNQLADREEFQDWMQREFPTAASELPDRVSRRRWLQLMGAALALGGLAGCRWQPEQFAPFTVRPQNRQPGEQQSFATCWELDGVARPLSVTSFDGRPVKIEGNAEHPFSRGGTDAFDQAMILSLYDPDRREGLSERVQRNYLPRSWEDLEATLGRRSEKWASANGRGLAVICGSSSSPTRRTLQSQITGRFPEMIWCEHETFSRANERRGTELAFGQPLRPHYDFDKAQVIVCFDADPFAGHPAAMRSVREWAERRDPDASWMNRLYCFESNVSLTGSNADHRVPVRSDSITEVIAALESLLDSDSVAESAADDRLTQTLHAVADDLRNHPGASLLMAGPHQPAEVHARLHRLHARLGNIGKSVAYTEDSPSTRDNLTTLEELTVALETGRIDAALLLDVNPCYGNPLSSRITQALQDVPLTLHAGLYSDESAAACRWHVPLAHPLESWSDACSWDGTITLAQPLIAPLFGGRTASELLSLLTPGGFRNAEDLIRETLIQGATAADPNVFNRAPLSGESDWRTAVHDGFIRKSQQPVVTPKLRAASGSERRDAASGDVSAVPMEDGRDGIDQTPGMEVVIRPDASVHDGRFANNSWLQETPDPLTKLTWDNAAVISPRTAAKLGVAHGDVVRIDRGDAAVELPVFELPGVAEDSIQLSSGYGRTAAGHVGGLLQSGVEPVGVDVSQLQDSGNFISGQVRVRKTGVRRELATTQDHFAIDATGLEAIGHRIGELVRTGTLAEYKEHPDFAAHRGPHHPPLESPWTERTYEGHAWGMAIDLNRCIGCNACTVACQSENNVPIVGREQVLAGREMSWIRVDRYFGGDPEEPEYVHQPVACHHCENAPCEQVCPVAATVHSDEGLNDMVYNRCVGTRYCANNCPYKVRRFNFFDYNAPLAEPDNALQKMIINPEVTVRSRGVMEKCTYCVQRIQDAKIDAGNHQRAVEDGDVVTACQQACPASAIMFGDLNDPESRVAQAHADSRAYGMLSELNTKPRTLYLARIRNPHPWLASSDPHHSETGESSHHA